MKKMLLFIITFCIASTYVFAQGGLGGNIRFGANFLGFNAGVPGSLEIRNDFTGPGQPINFFTNNTQQMTILGPTGFVGIGLSNPLYRLSVQDDINVNTIVLNTGYRINGIPILQTFGTRNTFVGIGTGFNNAGPLAWDNTFVGFHAGNANATGDRNTFVGSNSGLVITNGRFNTFIGTDAGRNFNFGNSNTFVGEHCGYNQFSGTNNAYFGSHAGQSTGTGIGNNNTFLGTDAGPSVVNADDNTFVGFVSGGTCNTGNKNSFFGMRSGTNTTSGSANVFLGWQAGLFNNVGDSNVYIGPRAGVQTLTWGNLVNAIAIGWRAWVKTNNTMVLGNNHVRVGIGLSNDPAGPGNKLEINGDQNSYSYTGVGGSGLRFRQLISTSTTQPNPNNVFLSVDANGDVILVNGGLGTGLGAGYCPALTPLVTGDAGYNMNGNNFYFDGNASGNLTDNSVIIGKGCGNGPNGKLDVLQNSTAKGSIGIYVENKDQADNTNNIPVIGLKSITSNSSQNCHKIAGWFESTLAPNCTGQTTQYAIFVPKGGGIVSIGYPLGLFNTFSDFLQVNSGIDAMGINYPSDSRYKTNLVSVTNSLEKIMDLNPVYFYYDTLGYPNYNFQKDRQIGVIAQNLDSILPEVVDVNSNGYYSVDYAKIVPLLLQGIKDLNAKIDSLTGNNARMSSNGNIQTIELSSDVILYQNMPNPFNNETVINYFLPDNVTTARMIFYDETGRVIKDEVIENRGNGSVTVNTQNLAVGIYSYSLEVNGKVTQTRKMQKIK